MKYNPHISTILYVTDLGSQTRPVFRYAVDMAKHYEAEIIMLHVVEPMSDTAKAVISTYLSDEASLEVQKSSMKDILAKMKERLKNFYREECDKAEKEAISVKEVLVVSGKPSEEILRVAEDEDANMIVMGKSARKVRGIRVMGSTARRVSRQSKVPVLIIPNR